MPYDEREMRTPTVSLELKRVRDPKPATKVRPEGKRRPPPQPWLSFMQSGAPLTDGPLELVLLRWLRWWPGSLHFSVSDIKNVTAPGFLSGFLEFLEHPQAPFDPESILQSPGWTRELEQALSVVRAKGHQQLPDFQSLANGDSHELLILMSTIFDIYAVRPVHVFADEMLQWFDQCMHRYETSLPQKVFTSLSEPDTEDNLWLSFVDGTAIACALMTHSSAALAAMTSEQRKLQLFWHPGSQEEVLDNLQVVYQGLSAADVPTLMKPDEMLHFSSRDVILVQMDRVYHRLRSEPVLPRAQLVTKDHDRLVERAAALESASRDSVLVLPTDTRSKQSLASLLEQRFLLELELRRHTVELSRVDLVLEAAFPVILPQEFEHEFRLEKPFAMINDALEEEARAAHEFRNLVPREDHTLTAMMLQAPEDFIFPDAPPPEVIVDSQLTTGEVDSAHCEMFRASSLGDLDPMLSTEIYQSRPELAMMQLIDDIVDPLDEDMIENSGWKSDLLGSFMERTTREAPMIALDSSVAEAITPRDQVVGLQLAASPKSPHSRPLDVSEFLERSPSPRATRSPTVQRGATTTRMSAHGVDDEPFEHATGPQPSGRSSSKEEANQNLKAEEKRAKKEAKAAARQQKKAKEKEAELERKEKDAGAKPKRKFRPLSLLFRGR